MKTVASILALLALGRSKKLLEDGKIQADAPSCVKVRCPKAWVPKVGHHTLEGSTPEECCDKTCELFECTGAYKANEDYFGNVGSSVQACCDKMCGSEYHCDVGYVLADSRAAGTTKEECCLPKCELFNCTAPWAPSAAKKEVVSDEPEQCCDQTCAMVNCSLPDWVVNESKASEVGSSPGACCTPTCGNAKTVCPFGHLVQEGAKNKSSDGTAESCCTKQCKAHVCSAGWAPDVSKQEDFGEDDGDCCLPTCKQFDCSLEDGWAPSNVETVGSNETQCCVATCKQWTCNAAESWLPVPGKENATGSSNSACCEPACSIFSCNSAEGRIPVQAAATVGGSSDDTCCESSKCTQIRQNMTVLKADQHCNDLSEAECETKYFLHADGNSSAVVTCTFDDVYKLCRYDVAAAIKGGCSGMDAK